MKTVTLTLDQLHKTYPNGQKAVNDISLTVEPGVIFGLIGPNGAGKTTLLKLGSGLLKPDSGQVFCNQSQVTGLPQQAARYVGLMPDPLGVYTDLSALEYLQFFSRVLELPVAEAKRRIEDTVHLLELQPWLESEVETLSAGWQRRLALGRVLLAQSPILLLDEPAAGLDISARSGLLQIIRQLAERSHTVVVSSHILPELGELAHRFGILSGGSWVEVGTNQTFFTQADLHTGFDQNQWLLVCSQPQEAQSAVDTGATPVLRTTQHGIFFSAPDAEAAAAALQRAVQRNVQVYEFSKQSSQLNEVVRQVLEGEGP